MRVDLRGADERLGYLAWAIEQSNDTQQLVPYLASPNSSTEAAVEWLEQVILAHLDVSPNLYTGEPPWGYPPPDPRFPRPLLTQYLEAIGGIPGGFLGNLPPQFGADMDQSISAYADDTAYQLMLVCFLGTLDGDINALRWLAVLMVRGGINRQLTISRFLALTTSERAGRLVEAPPDQVEVLGLAQQVIASPSVERVLPSMVTEYISRARNAGPTTILS